MRVTAQFTSNLREALHVLDCGGGHLGTRMWRRGADRDGFAANFVESEQLVTGEGFLASFVQVSVMLGVLRCRATSVGRKF